MRRLGILLIFLGIVLFVGPLVSRDLSFLAWTHSVDHWGPVFGNMIRCVMVMLGIVLTISAKAH
jgi:uncharacterized membrane protein